jgi:hypothetical protein
MTFFSLLVFFIFPFNYFKLIYQKEMLPDGPEMKVSAGIILKIEGFVRRLLPALPPHLTDIILRFLALAHKGIK